MTVHFIGAGPGAADILTLRGRDLIARCPVCLYAGSLVPAGVLAHCPPDARIVDTAPLSLDNIVVSPPVAPVVRVKARRTVQVARKEEATLVCTLAPTARFLERPEAERAQILRDTVADLTSHKTYLFQAPDGTIAMTDAWRSQFFTIKASPDEEADEEDCGTTGERP